MCLELRDKCNRPHNSHKIRWKVIASNWELKPSGPFRSFVYDKERWNQAEGDKSNHGGYGFHVFVTRAEAKTFLSKSLYDLPIYTISKVEVRGFLKSGSFRDYRCETWEEMKLPHSPVPYYNHFKPI